MRRAMPCAHWGSEGQLKRPPGGGGGGSDGGGTLGRISAELRPTGRVPTGGSRLRPSEAGVLGGGLQSGSCGRGASAAATPGRGGVPRGGGCSPPPPPRPESVVAVAVAAAGGNGTGRSRSAGVGASSSTSASSSSAIAATRSARPESRSSDVDQSRFGKRMSRSTLQPVTPMAVAAGASPMSAVAAAAVASATAAAVAALEDIPAACQITSPATSASHSAAKLHLESTSRPQVSCSFAAAAA
mmetsp:Transcript_101499/g.254447  ORF Transcript_101499/g.254447 Transcript_101499/m.254447 type:complete len:243 (+) Transcript_101499:92-820(+)